MSPRFAHNIADLAGELCLPEPLRLFLADTRKSLAVAGGLGRISAIEEQTKTTLVAGPYSAEDIALVHRLLDVAIERQRSVWFPE